MSSSPSDSPAEPSAGPPASAPSAGERAVAFYCPYCGEEDLEPVGERGGWWCHSCNRRFVVRLGVPDS